MSASLKFHASGNDKYTKLVGGASTRIALQMLRDIKPPVTSDSYVLDNACGPGIVTEVIKNHNVDTSIMCADLTQGMLDQVKTKRESKGWKKVETELLDMRDLKSLKDNSFSHSFTCIGLQSLAGTDDPDGPLEAVKELYRTAKVGGVCSIATWSDRSFPKAFEATAKKVRPDEDYISHGALPQDWDRASWLLRLMEDAGFGAQVSVQPCPTYNEYEDIHVMVDLMLEFQAIFFPSYSDQELEKVRAILKEELVKLPGFEAFDDGSVKMPNLAIVAYGWK